MLGVPSFSRNFGTSRVGVILYYNDFSNLPFLGDTVDLVANYCQKEFQQLFSQLVEGVATSTFSKSSKPIVENIQGMSMHLLYVSLVESLLDISKVSPQSYLKKPLTKNYFACLVILQHYLINPQINSYDNTFVQIAKLSITGESFSVDNDKLLGFFTLVVECIQSLSTTQSGNESNLLSLSCDRTQLEYSLLYTTVKEHHIPFLDLLTVLLRNVLLLSRNQEAQFSILSGIILSSFNFTNIPFFYSKTARTYLNCSLEMVSERQPSYLQSLSAVPFAEKFEMHFENGNEKELKDLIQQISRGKMALISLLNQNESESTTKEFVNTFSLFATLLLEKLLTIKDGKFTVLQQILLSEVMEFLDVLEVTHPQLALPCFEENAILDKIGKIHSHFLSFTITSTEQPAATTTNASSSVEIPTYFLTSCIYFIVNYPFTNQQGRERIFSFLLNSEYYPKFKNRVVNLTVAENVGKLMVDQTSRQCEEKVLEQTNLLPKLEKLIFVNVDEKTPFLEEKEFYLMNLLAIIKYWISFPGRIHFNTVERILRVLISLLKENNSFLRDMTTQSLIYLYYLSTVLNPLKMILEVPDSILISQSLNEYISNEIIISITRRKRPNQRVGFDAGGGNTRQQTAAEAAGTGQNQQTTGNNNLDQLLETAMNATNTEAAQLLRGMVETTANTNTANNPAAASTRNDADITVSDSGYSVYEKICNITKKINDGSVLMTALSLVRFDLVFGKNETYYIAKLFPLPDFSNQLSLTKLNEIIPMLYIAKFDPVQTIREIMQTVYQQFLASHNEKDIFFPPSSAASPSTSTSVNPTVKALFQLFNQNLLNPLWRERDATCFALENFLLSYASHLSYNALLKEYLPIFLEKGLKLLDDLRESTRKIASNLMKKLCSLILSLFHCQDYEMSYTVQPLDAKDSSLSSASQQEYFRKKEMIDLIFPIILNKGIVSPSVETKGFCLGLLTKILNDSSLQISFIYSWFEQLFDILLESISALEPQLLSYLEFHLHSFSTPTSRESYETMRMELMKNSPLHDMLKKLLVLLPVELVHKVVWIIYNNIYYGVGLPTRITACDMMILLIEKYPTEIMNPSFGNVSMSGGIKLMKEINKLISDKPNLEITLKKSLIHVLGTISKIIEPTILIDELEELMKKLVLTWKEEISFSYNNSSQELAIIICVQQIIQKAGDRILVNNSASASVLSSSMMLWYLLIGISYSCSFNPSHAIEQNSNRNTVNNSGSSDALEISQIMLSIYQKSLECSGIGNKLQSIEKAFPVINLMLLYDLNHFSWEKRKQGIQMIKDIFYYQQTSASFINIRKTSKDFLYLILSMFSLIPGVLWQGQDQLMEGLSFLIMKLSNEFFSFDVKDVSALENCVLELSFDEKELSQKVGSQEFIDPSSFPFSLKKMMIQQNKNAIVSETKTMANDATATNNIIESTTAMVIDQADVTSDTPSNTASTSNMEYYKQLREKFLNYSLSELQESVVALTGLTVRKQDTSLTSLRWKININALISLLLSELKRSDSNYCLIVSQCLSSLPWKEIIANNPAIYWNHFPAFIAITELNYQEKEVVSSNPESEKKVAETEVKKPPPAPAVNKQAFLFGNRYGTSAAPTKPHSRPIVPKQPQASTTTPPAATPTTTEPATKKRRISTSPYSPALRMHIIEMLSKGWNNQSVPETIQKEFPLSLLLKNLCDFYDEEVWSLKKSFLKLLGAIGSISVLSAEQLEVLFTVIEKSQLENKYVQVKLMGLECVQSLLLGVNASEVKREQSPFQERISNVLRKASSDTQPLVLEFVAKLKNT
jgi:hypothetical protein